MMESLPNGVRFEFRDSDSHIYDDPEFLMSDIQAKESAPGYCNQMFVANQTLLKQSLDEDWSRLEKKAEVSRETDEAADDSERSISASKVTSKPPSASAVPTLQVLEGLYNVPRNIMSPNKQDYMSLIGRVNIAENDYQDVSTSRSERGDNSLEAARRNGSLPPLTISSDKDDSLEMDSVAKDEDQYMEMNSPNHL